MSDKAEDYVAWVDSNVKAREQFFSDLHLDGIAEELNELEPRKGKGAKRKLSSPEDGETSPVESRKSSRPKKSFINYATPSTRRQDVFDDRVAKSNVTTPNQLVSLMKDCLSRKGSRSKQNPFERFGKNRLKVDSVSCGQVISGFSRSIAVHSSESKILAALGDSSGNVSIVVSASDSKKLLFQEFNSHDNMYTVNDLIFGSIHLLSCGQDGTLRKLDLVKIGNGFTTLYDSAGVPLCCMTVDNFDDIWLGQADGKLARFDMRTSSQCGLFSVCKGGISSVSASKRDGILLCTAAKTGKVAIWDIRMLQDPVASDPNSNCTGLISFSPIDSNVILMACCDNSIKVKRFDETSQNFDQLTSIKCDTIKRSEFHPAFHPNNGQLIAVSGPEKQLVFCEGQDATFTTFRQFDFTDKTFKKRHTYLAFHPTLPVVVSANCTGASVIHFSRK